MKKIFFVIALYFFCSASYSQKPTNENQKTTTNWRFELSSYAWLAGSIGTISFLDQSTTVYANFKDIFGDLKFGFFMQLEARKGKWVLFRDLSFISVEKSGLIEMESINVELKQTLADVGSAYNLITTLDNWQTIDALAGLRYFEIDNKINDGRGQILDNFIKVTGPFVGIRFRTVSEKWINAARIDIGGFDFGLDLTTCGFGTGINFCS